MMKHETLSKPLPIGFNLRASRNNLPVAPAASASKRSSLWRPRSSSEAPSSVPRSPITKAFDFLPWARNKKRSSSSEKAAAVASIAPTTKARNTTNSSSSGSGSNTTANTVVACTNSEGYKNNCIPYNRNIFRNSGGLIRDILSDKLNKEKHGSGTLPNPHKRCNQRRPKELVVGRNQSFDINELIDCVENELVADKKQTGSKRFLDDTFIDKIIRVKDENHRSGRSTAQAHDEEYMYSNYSYGDDVNEYDYEDDYKKSYAHEDTRRNNNNTSNNMNGHLPSSSKHILFNDENVVYLIKNELPVKRDAGKNKMALQKSTKVVSAAEKERSRLERETNVLRARLKFKKLPATEGAPPLAEHKSQLMNNQLQQQYDKHDHQQRNSSQQTSKSSLIDKFSSIGLDSFNFGSGSGEKSAKRGILQRQNTLPAAPPSHRSIDVSPELNKRHHQLYQRKEQRNAIQRRKSLTDTSYVPFNGLVDNSSSSSMGSGVGAVSGGGGGGGGGIISDRPKTDKPRKKLSFREPVVSEKTKSRRLSIPLNHVQSSNTTEDTNGNRDSSARSAANVSHDLNKRADNRGGHKADLADRDRHTDAESQAMRIVRTVGQAFEVCHKFNLHKNSLDNNDERSDVSSDLLDVEHISEPQLSEEDIAKKDQSGGGGGGMTPDLNPPQRPNHLELLSQSNLSVRKSPSAMSDEDKSPTTPSSPSREVHKLKDQLEQQALQTRQALAQLMLVREQLISETNARIEAQARTQQLLQQNRELLEHLASLGVYTEQQTPGLTTANIAMAPQSQLQMLLQATSNSNNLATINQQINNLGSINQQLTSLSHQLSGLNQQSQNLQNLQNISANLQQQQQHQQHQQQQQQHHQHHLQQPQSLTNLTSPASSTSFHQPPPPSPLHLNVSASNASSNTGTLSSSPFPSMNHLQSISSQLQNMSVQNSQQQQQDALSKDLLQVNQELLNRLQALNLSTGNHVASTSTGIALNGSPLPHTQQTPSPHSSFFFVNPMSCSPSNNNNSASNFNFLGSPGGGMGGGNLTPSPMSTLNRSSYSHSPINDELGLSIDRSLNSLDEHGLQKTLGHLCSTASNGNIAVCSSAGTRENSRSSSTIESPTSPNSRHSNGNGNGSCEPRFNTVTLKVTDEAGNVTNQRKLSATPSFITRSTSEKVPNRSQMMSQVQRTAWARHTTK